MVVDSSPYQKSKIPHQLTTTIPHQPLVVAKPNWPLALPFILISVASLIDFSYLGIEYPTLAYFLAWKFDFIWAQLHPTYFKPLGSPLIRLWRVVSSSNGHLMHQPAKREREGESSFKTSKVKYSPYWGKLRKLPIFLHHPSF